MIGRRRVTLFLASFLMLYFELVLIRWVPGHVRVLAYFTNFVLIACFFGMGLGLVLKTSRFDLGRWAAAGIASVVLLSIPGKYLWVLSRGDVFLFTDYGGRPEGLAGAIALIGIYPILIPFYAAIAAAFVPFGQLIGRSFGGRSPLADYSINLLGSIAGIGVFFVYSWFSLPAWSWFLLGMPLLAFLPVPTRSWRAGALAVAALVVALVSYLDRGTVWSPYHKLDFTPLTVDRESETVIPYDRPGHVDYLPREVGFNIRVNDDFYQLPMDLSDTAVARYPLLKKFQSHYDLPFRLKPNAKRVLIVGGGSGNDAAAALRNGARQIDVVDIDPEIVAAGRRGHPERPYSNPRVTVHIDDARHFFHRAQPGYDLVVFALLDSHRLLGTMSSLRLDSYVFTVEAFEETRRLLNPDGVQVTAFAVGAPWLKTRFYEMLRRAYEEEPIAANEHLPDRGALIFVSGPGSKDLKVAVDSGTERKEVRLSVQPRPVDAGAVVPTDDWPFIYAQRRAIPAEYLAALALVLALSALALRRIGGQRTLPDPHFFCLGAGFLLLETKNVTTLALVFGSTWYVNSVVFLSVLVMALAANLLLGLTDRIRVGWVYAGLFGAVALNYAVPLQAFAGESFAVRLIVVGGVTALPMFFSGIVFAHSFKRAADPASALGANVLGGVFGGVLEYASMVTGLRFLFLLIAGFYALSLLVLPGKKAAAVESRVAVAT